MNTLLPSTPIDFFQVSISRHFSRFSVSSSEEELDESFFFLVYFLRKLSDFNCAEAMKLNFYLNLYLPFSIASLVSLFHNSCMPFLGNFLPFGA